jgi:hypothetical protein
MFFYIEIIIDFKLKNIHSFLSRSIRCFYVILKINNILHYNYLLLVIGRTKLNRTLDVRFGSKFELCMKNLIIKFLVGNIQKSNLSLKNFFYNFSLVLLIMRLLDL